MTTIFISILIGAIVGVIVPLMMYRRAAKPITERFTSVTCMVDDRMIYGSHFNGTPTYEKGDGYEQRHFTQKEITVREYRKLKEMGMVQDCEDVTIN